MHPDVDEVIQSGVIKRHVVGMTIQLILVERHQASMIHEVVNGQLLLEDVPKVLIRVSEPLYSSAPNVL